MYLRICDCQSGVLAVERKTHLVKLLQVAHDHVPVLLDDRERKEEMEFRSILIRPKDLP